MTWFPHLSNRQRAHRQGSPRTDRLLNKSLTVDLVPCMRVGIPALLLLITFLLTPSHSAELELHFEHRFDTSPLFLDAVRYRLSAGEEISVTRLSYLLSGFALEKQSGGWVELTNQFAW